jgi:hypothetical protein
MPKGGARPGAGRKPKPKFQRGATTEVAHEVLASLIRVEYHKGGCRCEICRWREHIDSADKRLGFEALKYMTDRRDGKPTQVVRAEVAGSGGGPLVILTSIQRPAPIVKKHEGH